jgi:hypothetical protein
MPPTLDVRIIGKPDRVLDKEPEFQTRRGRAFIDRAEDCRAQGNIEEALRYYHMAESAFAILNSDHNRVIAWTYIAEMHRAKKQWNQVVQYCEQALDGLTQLQAESRATGQNSRADEYVAWSQRITQVSEDALQHYEPQPGGRPVGTINWAEFTQLPVLEESIPAGAPRNLTHLAHDNAAVHQLIIHSKTCEIKPLHKNRRVLFTSGDSYVIIPVIGNSMNEMDIVAGDFVILRLLDSGETPVNDDIVAAEMIGDDEATLKQYFVTDGKPYLRARSSDSQWRNVRLEVNNNVGIRGIAIAVLKPVSEG